MVTKLFTFIETTCSIKWKLHPDALADMIPNLSRMDRINYLQLSALHISDMRHLEKNDRDTWSYFMEGKFFCQKNDIPHEDIGQDYGKGKNGAMGVWSIKQLKYLEPLVHDSSNSVVNVPGNGEAWKKTEF